MVIFSIGDSLCPPCHVSHGCHACLVTRALGAELIAPTQEQQFQKVSKSRRLFCSVQVEFLFVLCGTMGHGVIVLLQADGSIWVAPTAIIPS